MGFYQEIAKYYDYIFPIGNDQLNLIKRFSGAPPKKLLDIACGTGGYSLSLSKEGYDMTAVDLDDRMIEELKLKALDLKLSITSIKGDMLTIGSSLSTEYDLAFCIGNSLVHLDGRDEIQSFFNQAKHLLGDGGRFIIQIINFDRILANNVTSLPTIYNKEADLSFERYYNYNESNNRIYFKTVLQVKNEKIDNEIPLYPLLSEDLTAMLKSAGFKAIKLFGDFKETDYNPMTSYMLVVAAK